METGLIFGYPNIPGTKVYNYHGTVEQCNNENNPIPVLHYPHTGGITIVVTSRADHITNARAMCVGEIFLWSGAGNCTWRGFDFGPTEEYDNFVFEFGDFPAGEYELEIEF